jgi:hypothetical protein
MFLFKSTHEAFLKIKESEIATLKDEIRWLRNFIQPAQTRPLVVTHEADAILEGRQDQLQPEEQVSDEVLRERDRLLSGQY